jgi:hypothetical protein
LIYICVCTVFAPSSPSYNFFPSPPLPTGTKPPGRTCSNVLFSNFSKRKENKWHFWQNMLLFKVMFKIEINCTKRINRRLSC